MLNILREVGRMLVDFICRSKDFQFNSEHLFRDTLFILKLTQVGKFYMEESYKYLSNSSCMISFTQC